MDSLKAGLTDAGLKFAVPEAHLDTCIMAFDGQVIVALKIVGDGHLLHFHTTEMMNISWLSELQQTLIRSYVSRWNAALPMARLSTEPTGQIIVENSIPIDDHSVMSARLLASIIVALVATWKEMSVQLKVLVAAMAVAGKTTNEQPPRSKPVENHRFRGFFSEN
jgi:hypothetical protein